MPLEDISLQAETSTVAYEVDIVAIHGILENSTETWSEPPQETWLASSFISLGYKARVLLYSYNRSGLISSWQSSSDSILSYATNLVAELQAYRELSASTSRPLIFLCHGFGGIILKRALALSASSTSLYVEHQRSIFVSTYGIMFFGTPHNGITKHSVLSQSRRDGSEPSQFILNLLKGSEILQEITDQFSPLVKRFALFYFWEELPTDFGDTKAFIVEADSAAPQWHLVERCGITATHSKMVKFSSRIDTGFQVVCGALVRYIKNAPLTITSRWRENQRLLAEERRNEAELLLQQHRSSVAGLESQPGAIVNEHFLVPRRSSIHFTGRSRDIDRLKSKLLSRISQSVSDGCSIFVIYGLGGSGKTQFSLRFVEEVRSSYWGVFWVDTSSDQIAEAGFSAIGQQAGKGFGLPASMHLLATCSKPWLLVLDNADDPDMDVSRYIPVGGTGHVLITTRNPNVIDIATIGHLRFRGMDPEEAVQLLLKVANMEKKSTSTTQSVARSIANELGYLALAITNAGATIRRDIYTLEKYLRYYLGLRKQRLDHSYITNADEANIVTTWEIPFQRLAAHKALAYNYAVEILHIFAFLHHESIPDLLFRRIQPGDKASMSLLPDTPHILMETSYWNEDTYARLRNALRILSEYSIVERDKLKETCMLHPVVHQWAQERLSLSEQRKWASITAQILADNIWILAAAERPLRALLLPHIDSCLRKLNQLYPDYPEQLQQALQCSKFASVYAENGLWKQARLLQSRVVAFRTKVQGVWHEDTLSAQADLARTLWHLFDVRGTIEIEYSVMKRRWWKRPSLMHWIASIPWKPMHVSYGIVLTALTQSLWLASKRDLSLRVGRRATDILHKTLGQDDPFTLEAQFNLARTYLHVGEVYKAHQMLLVVVRKRKLFFGPIHPDTLTAKNELSMCLRALGKYKLANRILENVVKDRTKILGEEHAYTLWSMNDLAKLQGEQGNPNEAIEILSKVLPISIRTLGEDHVGVLMTKSNLARAYAIAERWNEASDLIKSILPMVPRNRDDWVNLMGGYIHIQTQLERLDHVEENSLSMLDMMTGNTEYKKDDERLIGAGRVLLWLYEKQGRPSKITELKRRYPALVHLSTGSKDGLKRVYRPI